MALKIDIEKNTGHVNPYWRIVQLAISVLGAGGNVQVAGYASQEDRAAGKTPDDMVAVGMTNEQVVALSATTVVQHLARTGVDTSAWPPDVLAALGQVRLYDQIATALYVHLREPAADGTPSRFAGAENV